MSTAFSETRSARKAIRAKDLVVLAALVLLAFAVSFDAWSDLLRTARRDEESSHILLVPFVVLWLLWGRRGRLKHVSIYGRWLGPVFILAGGIIKAIGDQYLYAALWHLGAVLLLLGPVFTVLGMDVLRKFFPAFLVLVFLIPIPGRLRQQIAIPLQEATASVTGEMCTVVGVELERTGNLIRINGVDVAVGEACNGMRMIFALILVSYTFAFTTALRPFVRVIIVTLSPIVALFCNVVRLIPTVLVYGSFDSDSAQSFHDLTGWVMLFVAFGLLLSVITLLRWMYIPVSPFRFAHD